MANNNWFLLTPDHKKMIHYNNMYPNSISNVLNIHKIKYDKIYAQLTTSIWTYKKILSYFPGIFVKIGENMYFKVFS